MNTILWLLTALVTKHFIVDFLLQTKYQWSNKGTYGHMGGVLHAWLHGIGTSFCLALLAPNAAYWLVFADMIIHYHVDWAKMNLNAKLGWGPTTHEEFWWLLGLDQFLHTLTYIGIVAVASGVK